MPLAAGPGPIVLDGGLATELEARGHDLRDRLWSARLLMTDPEAIEDVHLAYFRAGAKRGDQPPAIRRPCRASPPPVSTGRTALEAIRSSVRLAQARARAGRRGGCAG